MRLIDLAVLALLGLLACAVLAAVLWHRLRRAARDLQRFQSISDAEEHVRQIRLSASKEAEKLRSDAARAQSEAQRQCDATLKSVEKNRALIGQLEEQLGKLRSELGGFDERVGLSDVGLLAPRYDFAQAVEYAAQLDRLRSEQAAAVKSGAAARCGKEWTIEGSRTEGKRTTDRILKLMLRAFNGECDALISKVKYDNARSFDERIRKAVGAINNTGGQSHLPKPNKL